MQHVTIMAQAHPVQNGEIMFITTNIRHRRRIFADPACARIAIEVLYDIQEFYPFFLFGFVVMPDHCHFLLRIPDEGFISKMMNIYKRAVAFNIGQGPIWQSSFHIRIPDNPQEALAYIHRNPVQSGLSALPEGYPWSSASGKWDVMDLAWS